MPFGFKKLGIPEVILVESRAFSDERGLFMESFKESVFSANGINTKFVQDNFSHSTKGALRGLHYQKNPKAQAKLVMVITGEIFDVAVDIRKGSPTYGRWVGQTLSDKNHNLLYIPEGFAHGFCVTSDKADVLYKVNSEYSPEHERGILWNDPDLSIKWPQDKPIMISKDLQLPILKNADNNFVYQ
jgi:dTDP-4-dehydrorhamnose 3,5-epimerase